MQPSTPLQGLVETIEALEETPPTGHAWPEVVFIRGALRLLDRYRKAIAPRRMHHRMRALQGKGLTVREIASVLNMEGPPPPRGGRWHHQRVAILLRQMAADKT